MSRYFSRPILRAPRAWIEDEGSWQVEPLVPSLSVSEHEAINTGLLDVRGEAIWRAPNPVGFKRDDEW